MSVTRQPQTSRAGGLGTALLEIVLSFGLYYLLRAFGVAVFWALTGPAIAIGVVAVAVTVRRRRVDMIGLLVLIEIGVTLTLSLVTQSARVAALREPLYFAVAGAFCLVTLLQRAPFSHVATAALATFGDPKRERAFAFAWREVPRYRFWQRVITVSQGLLMIVSAVVRAVILYTTDDAGLSHAVDVSNILTFVTLGAVAVVSAVLIQQPKKIIEGLLEQS